MACVRRSQLQFLYLTLISLFSPAALVASITLNVSPPPDCPDKCGNITIPYPFGTHPECRRDDGFNITCNESTTPPKAFLGSETSNIELIDININSGEVRVYKFIAYRCYNNSRQVDITNYGASIDLTGSPYLFSNRRNKFTTIGCSALAYVLGQGNTTGEGVSLITGCVSFCESQIINNTTGEGVSCNGLGCCQTAIPANLNYYNVSWGYDTNLAWGFNPCIYAALVEEDWYKFRVQDLSEDDFLVRNQNRLPVVLDWAIRDNGTCQNGMEESPNPACVSKNSTCRNTSNGEGYFCQCMDGFDGNPYIQDGCMDIDECEFPDKYPCHGICLNTEGSYECFCRKGTRGNAIIGNCTHYFPFSARFNYICMAILLGFVIAFGILLLYVVIAKHIKLFKKNKKEKLKHKFFVQNQGLLLQQLIKACPEDTTQIMRILGLDELETATNNFNSALIIGRGGHGEVFKGILSDQRVVAIKRSKMVDQAEIHQFINEVVLLSQFNHRNIVKLYSCCLETEVPLLVYEFISNGTLSNHLHVEENCSLTWKHRLRIALEAARAISYLHSSACISVFHRDVKSSNILLDDYLTAKVSDFGASRCVQIDQTGVTTAVQGTFGYLDPEYFRTGRLTPKSDVYSFGVILAELLTRQKALVSSRVFEGGSLIEYFSSAMKENCLFEILDPQIVNEGQQTELEAVAKLAEMCLRMRGEERPMMKEVEVQLGVMWRPNQQPKQYPWRSESLEDRQLMLFEEGTTSIQCSFEQELQS